MAHPGGRPPRYKTKEELQEAIDKYFKECFREEPVIGQYGPVMVKDPSNPDGDKIPLMQVVQWRPFTVTGLAIACDMDRQRLINYTEKEEFYDTIKRAKEICQQFAEERLFLMKNATGAIFSLKNNWKWVDKTEQDLNISGSIGLAERIKRGRERLNDGNSDG